MDSRKLHDLICRGMGNAARVIGEDYDVFRADGPFEPLASANRMMRMPIILENYAANYRRVKGVDQGLRATFDSISTRVGDYLCGPAGTLFVAAVPERQQPVCVLTTDVVDVYRTRGPTLAGLNGYGGVTEGALEAVLTKWSVQVSVVGAGKRGALPADRAQSELSILFPPTPVPILAADIVEDDCGHRFVVLSAEGTTMGWRLIVRGSEV